jgi:hypothetical protein
MLGESVISHPAKPQIDEMFNNGHTAEEVAAWLRQTRKDKREQTSKVSLQYYRKNILGLDRLTINQKRNEFLALGKTHDANVLTTFTAAKDFIDAKNKQKEEVDNVVNSFKQIITETENAVKLIKEQTVDDQGRAVFIPRNYEVLEKLLGRAESASNSFIKAYTDSLDRAKKEAIGNTTININQAQQESDIVKNAIKRILMEIDASKVARFWEIMREEAAKADVSAGVSSGLKIEINNSSDTTINITTSLPTPEDVEADVRDDTNENTQEHIVEVEVNPDPNLPNN